MRTLHLALTAAATFGLAACPAALQPPVDSPAWAWLQARHDGREISVTYDVYAEEQTAVCGVVADGHGPEAPQRRYAYRLGPEGEAGDGWLGESVLGEGPHWTEGQCQERLQLLAGELRP